MPRYVILHHELPRTSGRASHYDVMLELGGALRTWAIADVERLSAGEEVSATSLADHRLAYLNYEGEVSRNRGHVARWDAGDWELVAESDGVLSAKLTGAQLQGTLIATHLEGEKWMLRLS
jgi:hypothetical protein